MAKEKQLQEQLNSLEAEHKEIPRLLDTALRDGDMKRKSELLQRRAEIAESIHAVRRQLLPLRIERMKAEQAKAAEDEPRLAEAAAVARQKFDEARQSWEQANFALLDVQTRKHHLQLDIADSERELARLQTRRAA